MLKPYANSMLKGFLALAILTVFSSCEKDESFDSLDVSQSKSEKIDISFKNPLVNARQIKSVCGNSTTKILYAGKTIPVGEVSAYNDKENLYVTISIEGDYANDWFIRKTHLYIGKVSLDFATGVGKKKDIINPAPGKFPFFNEVASENPTGIQEYTYTIPIGEDEYLKDYGDFDIAVHADVVQVANIQYNSDGIAISADVVRSEGAWADGTEFSSKGNWATYFNISVQDCLNSCNPDWYRNDNKISSNTEEILTVEYALNSNGIEVGNVEIKRGGSKSSGFKFTITFAPNTGYDFVEIGAAVTAISNPLFDKSNLNIVTSKVDGKWVILIQNAEHTSTGNNAQAAESFVHLYAKTAKVCD